MRQNTIIPSQTKKTDGNNIESHHLNKETYAINKMDQNIGSDIDLFGKLNSSVKKKKKSKNNSGNIYRLKFQSISRVIC